MLLNFIGGLNNFNSDLVDKVVEVLLGLGDFFVEVDLVDSLVKGLSAFVDVLLQQGASLLDVL